MKPVNAGLTGSLTGMLFALAICLVQSIPVIDALFRILILTFAGAWMGVLLAWLNLLLPTHRANNAEQEDSGA